MSEFIHKDHNVTVLLYHFPSTVGKHGDEKKIGNYVQNQRQEYQQHYFQPGLF